MRRTFVTLAALSFVAVPTGATAGGGCHSEHPAEEVRATRVVVEHACFGPTVVRVPLGGKVTWVNESGLAHNITGPAIQFTDLGAGGTYSRHFNEQGIYVYACTIHPGMSGAVVVRDEGEPGAADGAAAAAAEDTIAAAPAAASEPESGNGPTATGWLVAGAIALAATGAVAFVTRTTRTRGVPHPAR